MPDFVQFCPVLSNERNTLIKEGQIGKQGLKMSENIGYPRVEIDLGKLLNNVEQIVSLGKESGVEISGVIKGFTGIPQASMVFEKGGCTSVGSSRLEQLKGVKEAGCKLPLMLIRIPMLSEVSQAVAIADISLNSEWQVLKALDKEAGSQGKSHGVILMADLGDLREGYWDKGELLSTALKVESELKNLNLLGIGTNLGCYGSVAATPEKLSELVDLAKNIEKELGRKLRYVSGGATSSIPRLIDKSMPKGINMIRVGEGIILAKDLRDLYGYDMSFMYQDAFVLKAEIVEVKEKPSYPQGEIMYDAFGNKPEYEDRGIRKKALVAVGKVDYGYLDKIYVKERGATVLGASSDHTILDIEDAEREIKLGDIIEFNLSYASIVFATNCPNVKIMIRE